MTSLQYKLTDCSTVFDNENPWADDYLDRQNAAQSLCRIIEGQENTLTICLNGEWGSGKTFFLKRFERDYNRKEPVGRAVYFNAWEDDFLDDPLLAIISQLKGVAQEPTLQSLYKSVKKAAVPFLIKTGAKIGKQVVKQLTGVDVSEVLEKDLKTDREDLFGLYDELNKSRRDLRSALTFFAEAIFKVTGKPLVFIVDELDRCRPTFAIEVLERVKHLFSVPHLVFLVGVDVRQLSQSIKAVYGDIDANDYLHRFFDLEVKLPVASARDFTFAIWDMMNLEKVAKDFGVASSAQGSTVEQMILLFRFQKMSLRQIEKVVRTYAYLVSARKSVTSSWVFLAAIAVVLKVIDEEMYVKFIGFQCGLGELINTLYPEATYSDIDNENGIFQIVQWLNRVYHYGLARKVARYSLAKIKELMDAQQPIEYDKELMPVCFKDCSADDRRSFYGYVFSEDARMHRYGLSEAVSAIAEIDKGVRFLT